MKHTLIKWLGALLMLSLLLGGCKPDSGSDPADSTGGTGSADPLVLVAAGETDFRIVYGAEANRVMRETAMSLQARLEELTGVKLPCVSDDSEAQAHEILVGETNRRTDYPTLGEREVYAAARDGRILILAQDTELLEDAVELLAGQVVQEDDGWQTPGNFEIRRTVEEPAVLELRMASFNIHLGGMEVAYDLSLLAEDIRASGADIIGLQEVYKNTEVNRRQDTMKLLAEELGFYYYFAPAKTEAGGGEYGDGLLSRYPIEYARSLQLPLSEEDYTGKEPRVVIEARINVNGTKVYVYNTHVDQAMAEESLKFIYELASEHDPYIVMGDFNYNNFDMFDYVFQDCTRANHGTATTRDGYMFDNMMFSPSVEMQEFIVNDTKHSDHYMIICPVTVELPD